MATHWIIPIQNSIKNLLPILKLIQKRLENVRDITADLVFYPSSCGALSAIFFFFLIMLYLNTLYAFQSPRVRMILLISIMKDWKLACVKHGSCATTSLLWKHVWNWILMVLDSGFCRDHLGGGYISLLWVWQFHQEEGACPLGWT